MPGNLWSIEAELEEHGDEDAKSLVLRRTDWVHGEVPEEESRDDALRHAWGDVSGKELSADMVREAHRKDMEHVEAKEV